MAYTDVGTDLQGTCHINIAIATATPVVVLHRTTMHHFHAATCMNDIAGVGNSVIKCYEERGDLEYGTWLATITNGRINGFDVISVFILHHVDNGLHIASSYFHKDSDTHLTVHLRALQHIEQRTLGQVLHVDINRCDDITSVNRKGDGDVHVFV